MQQHIVYPLAAYFFYLFLLFFYVVFSRISSVQKGETPHWYFKNYVTKEKVPEKILILERHVDNQFQLPMIFFATGAVCLALNINDEVIVYSLWAFVVSRFLHSFIHLGSNHVLYRAGAYALGWLSLAVIWAQVTIFASS